MYVAQFTAILSIIIWPAVAIWIVLIFKESVKSFLKSAKLDKIRVFGIQIETTAQQISNAISENFDDHKLTNSQWNFLVELEKHRDGLSEMATEELGYVLATDLRPLRNSGLIKGDGKNLAGSQTIYATPLGRFLVSHAMPNEEQK